MPEKPKAAMKPWWGWCRVWWDGTLSIASTRKPDCPENRKHGYVARVLVIEADESITDPVVVSAAELERMRKLTKAADEYRSSVIAVAGPLVALDESLVTLTVDEVERRRDVLIAAALHPEATP